MFRILFKIKQHKSEKNPLSFRILKKLRI